MSPELQGSGDKPGRLLVFTATYNELDNVQALLKGIWAVDATADVLVVDDQSPDGTGALLDRLAAADQRLKVVHRPAKLGLGTAHHLGMLFAIRQGYDTLVTMDADRSHDPRDIPRLIEKLAAADFVIGSRYMPGGACDYGGYRRFVSVAANAAARLLLGIPLHEFTTSFRAFRVRELARVNFVKMHNQGYSFFMESVYRFHQTGLRLEEVPINFRDRYTGVSKIPRFEIVRGIGKLLHLVASRFLRRRMPPPSPPMSDKCADCGSGFLSERFPRRLEASNDADRSSAFRCSSMAHTRKPTVALCVQCGLSQVPHSEQAADLEQLYADVVDQTYLDNLPAKKKTFAHAYERLQRFLPKPGRLLEVGSYCGLFLQEASARGWTVQGIEPSRWASDYAKSATGLDIVRGSFEDVAPSLPGGFDVVVSWDVLEHVRDPRRFLETAHSLLRPGGILALSTIDIDSRFARLMGRRWPWIMEMHLYYFGAGSLERMFRDAGFERVRVEPYRHYASLRYIYRKLCAAVPGGFGKLFAKAGALVPDWVLPVSLGDVKLYVGAKR
jgi:dolichol-phosphate mannosyltransferase